MRFARHVLDILQHRVAVAVDDQVNALHVVADVVAGAVAHVLHAQVGQAHHIVGLFLLAQLLHHGPGVGCQPFHRAKITAKPAVAFKLRFRRGKAKHPQPHAVPLNHGVGHQVLGLPRLLVVQLGQHGERHPFDQIDQLEPAIVKLVVAQGHGVVPHGVHDLHRGLALACRDEEDALGGVPGVQQEHRTLRRVGVPQGRHPVQPDDRLRLLAAQGVDGGIIAVDVVGVDDSDGRGRRGLLRRAFGGRGGGRR